MAVDGHGVILNNNSEHSVVRMDAVAAVRVTTTDNTHDTLGSPPEQTPLNRRPSTTFSTPTPTSRTNSPSPAGSPRLELPPNVTAGRIGVSGRLSITRDAVRDWVKRDQIDAETSLAGQR